MGCSLSPSLHQFGKQRAIRKNDLTKKWKIRKKQVPQCILAQHFTTKYLKTGSCLFFVVVKNAFFQAHQKVKRKKLAQGFGTKKKYLCF